MAYNGAIVKDFWFEFKDGQVVDYDAKEGKEVLTSILETDEGSKYLGEIALVPYGSPISALDTLFYETLIDEMLHVILPWVQAIMNALKKV